MKMKEDELATSILNRKDVVLKQEVNKWKQNKIKLATSIFLKEKCLGLYEWNFKHVTLSVG